MPSVCAIRFATISEVCRRSASTSKRQSCESAKSGKDKMSTSRFLAKTVLPAPINVIFRFGFSCVIFGRAELRLGRNRGFVLRLGGDGDDHWPITNWLSAIGYWLFKQIVYLLVSGFECGRRVCSVEINSIESGSHNTNDITGVVSNRKEESCIGISCLLDEGGNIDAFLCHSCLGDFRGLRYRWEHYAVLTHNLLSFR